MRNSLDWLKSLHVSDLRGAAGVAVRTTRDVTGVAEGVHRSIHATLGLPGSAKAGRTAGITGLVYRSIDGVTRLTGAGLEATLGLTESLAARLGHQPRSTRERDVFLGVVNGVLGDRLESAGNPLALPFTLRHHGRIVPAGSGENLTGVSGRILVKIHGLCMTEHGWQPPPGAATDDLGAILARRFGYTPLYLRYNSGRAISANGEALAEALEALVATWPVPVEDLTLLGHSMGGLVSRSAASVGARQGHQWTRHLKHLVFLGTPHHGAPLERAGAWIDSLLHTTPYTRPFTALTRGRSRGIQDLRHGGSALASPGGGEADPAPLIAGKPQPAPNCPLPPGVHVLAIAGTRSNPPCLHGPERLSGDGLVPVASALGRHADPHRDLGLPESARVTLPGVGHMDLLDAGRVAPALVQWLSSLD